MNLECDSGIAAHLKSPSQQVRLVTENWFGSVAYCVACSSSRLDASKANSIASDFVCPLCNQSYELKSSKTVAKKRIADGAYETMLSRISSQDAPALVLLHYVLIVKQSRLAWSIKRVVAIHPVFLTPAVVEPRQPLGPHARRAGWRGCNLRIDRIPPEGQIPLVENGIALDPIKARSLYNSSRRLSSIDPAVRGWTALVLSAVRRVGNSTVELRNLYEQKLFFEEAFPGNRNVEAKVRQQLQVLRDLGYLRFLGSGRYEVVS